MTKKRHRSIRNVMAPFENPELNRRFSRTDSITKARAKRFKLLCKEFKLKPWAITDPNGKWMELCMHLINRLHAFGPHTGGKMATGVDLDYSIFLDCIDMHLFISDKNGKKKKWSDIQRVIAGNQNMTTDQIRAACNRTIKRVKENHPQVTKWIEEDSEFDRHLEYLIGRDDFITALQRAIQKMPVGNAKKEKIQKKIERKKSTLTPL